MQRLIVANRTLDNAQALAGRFGGYAIALSDLERHLAEADIVISSTAALFYLAGYSFMVLGSFGVVGIFGRRGDGRHSLADYTGIAAREPVLAFVLTVFLLAQAGVPLTVGFVAKFQVIMSAVEGGSWPLALIAMVSAVISAFLYLKIIIAMYVADEEPAEAATPAPRLAVPWGTKLGLGLAFLFVVGVGIIPGPITNLAHHAVPATKAPIAA